MSDQPKKHVSVKTPENLDGVNHDGANYLKVADGHLSVCAGGAGSHDVIAIYAPGRWVSAVVNK